MFLYVTVLSFNSSRGERLCEGRSVIFYNIIIYTFLQLEDDGTTGENPESLPGTSRRKEPAVASEVDTPHQKPLKRVRTLVGQNDTQS